MKRNPLVSKHGFIIGSESHKNTVKELKEVLRVFHRYSLEKNLSYWADLGTLLGVYRHRDIIPWDEDVDLAIRERDWIHLSNLWSSAGHHKAYLNRQGKPWHRWQYKNIVLCNTPLILLKFEGNDRKFKLRLASHVTYSWDISGVDLHRRKLVAGVEPDRSGDMIQAHRFGDGVIMAPKREYGEPYLCEKYGDDWRDWKNFLEREFHCPRNDDFGEITLDKFYQYCSRSRQSFLERPIKRPRSVFPS